MNRQQINTLKSRILQAITTPVCGDFDEGLQCQSIRIIILDEKGFIADIAQFDIVDLMTKKGDPRKFVIDLIEGHPNRKYTIEAVSLCSR